MATLFDRTGFNFTDTSGTITTLPNTAIQQLNTAPALVPNQWMRDDLINDDTTGYYVNPVANSCNIICLLNISQLDVLQRGKMQEGGHSHLMTGPPEGHSANGTALLVDCVRDSSRSSAALRRSSGVWFTSDRSRRVSCLNRHSNCSAACQVGNPATWHARRQVSPRATLAPVACAPPLSSLLCWRSRRSRFTVAPTYVARLEDDSSKYTKNSLASLISSSQTGTVSSSGCMLFCVFIYC